MYAVTRFDLRWDAAISATGKKELRVSESVRPWLQGQQTIKS